MAPSRLGASLDDRKRAVGSADDGDACGLVGLEPEGQGNHVGPEDAELGSRAYQNEFRIGYQGREVGHGSDAEEHQGRVPAGAHPLVERIEHGTFLVDADFQTCVYLERYVAYQYAEAYGDKQHWLKVSLEGQVQEEQAHNNHGEVSGRSVGKAGVRPEVGQVVA